MKQLRIPALAAAAALLLVAPPALRGGEYTPSVPVTNGPVAEEANGIAEFDLEATYIGESDFERGFNEVDDLDEFHHLARFVYTPRIAIGILRLGAEWEGFHFGHDSFLLPEDLNAVSLIVGLDTKFSDSLLFRLQANPGFYGSDDIDGDTFMVPFILGGTYIVNSNLQITGGIGVNFDRRYPVLPGFGVRWRMSSQWVLNAVMPNPRLEFEMTPNFRLYGGASLRGGTFRVDDDFGDRRFNANYNSAVVDYTQIRTGGGLEWQITPWLAVMAEGGVVPYRNFDFHRVDARYDSESAPFYGAIAIHGNF